MNWKGFGRKRSWSNRDCLPGFVCTDWGEPRQFLSNDSLRVSNDSNRVHYFPIASAELYSRLNLPSSSCAVTKCCYKVGVTLWLTVSHSVCLGAEPTLWTFDQMFLFKSLGLEFVVLSVWGALSDERPGLSFKSQSSNLSVCTFTINIFVFHTFTICIYALFKYNYNYNIYKATFRCCYINTLREPIPWTEKCTLSRRGILN
jgi:hypothetical protein